MVSRPADIRQAAKLAAARVVPAYASEPDRVRALGAGAAALERFAQEEPYYARLLVGEEEDAVSAKTRAQELERLVDELDEARRRAAHPETTTRANAEQLVRGGLGLMAARLEDGEGDEG